MFVCLSCRGGGSRLRLPGMWGTVTFMCARQHLPCRSYLRVPNCLQGLAYFPKRSSPSLAVLLTLDSSLGLCPQTRRGSSVAGRCFLGHILVAPVLVAGIPSPLEAPSWAGLCGSREATSQGQPHPVIRESLASSGQTDTQQAGGSKKPAPKGGKNVCLAGRAGTGEAGPLCHFVLTPRSTPRKLPHSLNAAAEVRTPGSGGSG